MVRHADTPTVEVETEIAAPPSVVWRFVSDIDLPARFSAEFQGAEWLDGAERPSLGARFAGRNRHDAVGEWTTTCTVVDYEPERTFGWLVNDPESPAARWRFDLEPIEGGTRLRQWARMGPGRSGVTWFIRRFPDQEEQIVGRRLEEWRANMEETVAGIKELAEAAV